MGCSIGWDGTSATSWRGSIRPAGGVMDARIETTGEDQQETDREQSPGRGVVARGAGERAAARAGAHLLARAGAAAAYAAVVAVAGAARAAAVAARAAATPAVAATAVASAAAAAVAGH